MSGARPPRVRPAWLFASLVGLLGAPQPASAQPAEAPPTQPAPVEAPPTTRATPGLVVIVQADGAHLDPYQVRRAVEDELGVPVLSTADERAAGTLTVLVHGDSDLEMTYLGKDGRRHSRTLKLPASPAKRLETVALVAGNLARDETGQLIEALRPPQESTPLPPAPSQDESEETTPPEASTNDARKPKQPAKPAVATSPKPPGKDETSDTVDDALIDEPLNLSFFHPLALYPDSEKRRFALDLGFAYSHAGAVDGVAWSVFVSRIDRELSGVQVGGFGTMVGGELRGGALSGIYSHHTGDALGVVVAGVGSYSSGSLRGARLSGVAGWQGGSVTGAQISGIGNVTGPVRGAALAGVTNVARGTVQGAQIAGVANVAGNVDGVQLGLVNVGQRVRGVQLGLVNVADEVDGMSIALVPIVGKGHQRLVVWSAPGHAIANLGAKFENGPFYTLIGIGYEPEPSASHVGGGSGRYYPTAALGTHVGLGPAFLEFDVQFQSAQRIEDGSDQHHAIALRPKLGWQPFERFGAFAGLAAERRMTREENLNLRGFAGLQVF